MHDAERTANLLGAAALAVSDVALVGADGVPGVSRSGMAALVVLSDVPGLGVTELGRRVGLTQSAAARMVDSLEEAGLVRRRRGAGRGVPVAVTERGGEAARAVLSARGAPLAELVGVLDEEERASLDVLLGKLLAALYERVGNAELMCRMCDRACCVRGAVCPVGQAERDRRSRASGGGGEVRDAREGGEG
ncbi:MarR family winged helix-turn-helix transcriptional regulator [Actinomadura yumaensis]|uniref:MarR family winged helix-turn-helix transcriptional regulator n=1 Tax=Actinomadura yumaensis TaxID=111807 RepID=A0ABW2CZ56_9ACTN